MASHERFAAATPDMVEAIVTGIGEFAADVYAPLNRVGDTNNPKWSDGAVTMPPGFKQAYRHFVEAGCGSMHGPGASRGRDLAFTLAAAVSQAVASTNHGFRPRLLRTTGAAPRPTPHGPQ